jgi:hypothetical protein
VLILNFNPDSSSLPHNFRQILFRILFLLIHCCSDQCATSKPITRTQALEILGGQTVVHSNRAFNLLQNPVSTPSSIASAVHFNTVTWVSTSRDWQTSSIKSLDEFQPAIFWADLQ